MAKKITQAAAIREALGDLGVDASGNEVVEYVDSNYPEVGLGSKQHAHTLVSMERTKLRGGKKRKKGAKGKRKVVRQKPTASRGAGRNSIDLAIDLVESAGSIEAAREQLERVEKIRKLRLNS